MSASPFDRPDKHPFLARPNRTLFRLAVPVLFSLVAEPLTGLADTAFVARLPGSEPVAALGVGTMAFTSIFWAFNFLGVGTQTEVAHGEGEGNHEHAVRVTSLAMLLALVIGLGVAACIMPFLSGVSQGLGAQGAVGDLACSYMYYRLLGAPAVLLTLACFGALRGVQDMRTPLYVAVAVNALNLALDWLLIFGAGPVPSMGVAGAAIASTVSQWAGAVWTLIVVARTIGLTLRVRGAGLGKLLAIGGDLFVRTGVLLVFLLFCTRVANRAGPDEGAAYQAIRQFFIFTAMFLDAFAITGQSLVGFFLGARMLDQARRVARFVCLWSLGTGVALCAGMLAAKGYVTWLLVPEEALEVFGPAWVVVSLMQPLGALSFATDGLLWGAGDFRFLRNVMILASVSGAVALLAAEHLGLTPILVWIWLASSLWTLVRSVAGLARVWPGIGQSPLGKGRRESV